MGDLLWGLDLCLDPTNLGPQDPEGHYLLGYGLKQRTTASSTWTAVSGFGMNVKQNTDFVVTVLDLSGQLGQIDFTTIAWRPDESATSPATDDSPFNSHDFDEMIQGKVLTGGSSASFCACGSPSNAKGYAYGQYTLRNLGPFDVTIETRISYGGLIYEFKCDPKIIVGS